MLITGKFEIRHWTRGRGKLELLQVPVRSFSLKFVLVKSRSNVGFHAGISARRMEEELCIIGLSMLAAVFLTFM